MLTILNIQSIIIRVFSSIVIILSLIKFILGQASSNLTHFQIFEITPLPHPIIALQNQSNIFINVSCLCRKYKINNNDLTRIIT